VAWSAGAIAHWAPGRSCSSSACCSSSGFLQPDVPRVLAEPARQRSLLVIGWVGLWYPLDLLFFARQPLKREALIVEAISRMPLSVQPADVP
jgi:hypothetical protein